MGDDNYDNSHPSLKCFFFFCERQENKDKLGKQNAQSDTVKKEKNKLKAVVFFYRQESKALLI